MVIITSKLLVTAAAVRFWVISRASLLASVRLFCGYRNRLATSSALPGTGCTTFTLVTGWRATAQS
jgi:hypothetical protein